MEFKEFNNVLVCPVPYDEDLDMEEIERIVVHTHNTWQHDRPIEEIRANTIQGKKAEWVIEKILEENCESRYISYDSIRNDGFEKHAPFDGIIFGNHVSQHNLSAMIDRINCDVENSSSDSGLIKPETREVLEDNGVYTVEIKSSLLQDPRDYKKMVHKSLSQRDETDYKILCEYITDFYDYFVYPHYCRDSQTIRSFYDYTVYVRRYNERYRNCTPEEFLKLLMREEFENACNIYTRVFFDVISNEIIIPGYITKTRFFEEPRIQKMPSPKSWNAIYYMFHMKYGKCFLEIDQDQELRAWNRLTSYATLFGKKQRCVSCGQEMKMRETTKGNNDNHKFLYLCDNCRPQKWLQMNEVNTRNMGIK